MTSLFSKRLLINLSVVVAAVGANAFVAYAQICSERDTEAHTLRSMSIKRDIDAYRATLGDGLAALSRFESQGAVVTATFDAVQRARLTGIKNALRGELAGDATMREQLDALFADAQTVEVGTHEALVRAASAAATADGVRERAWAAAAYTALGAALGSVDASLAKLRQREDLALDA